jgi:hypothetical protein
MAQNKKIAGRKSKLTDAQRDDIRRRILAGEQCASLGREYGVDDKVIRRLKSLPSKDGNTVRVPVKSVKDAAHKSMQNDLSDPIIRPLLDIMGQKDRDLFYAHKADLMEVAMQLNMTARYSAQNAHKLSRMAQAHLSKINEESPNDDGGRELLNDAMMYQDAANESSKVPLKLFEIATKQPPPPIEDKPLRIIGGLPDNV